MDPSSESSTGTGSTRGPDGSETSATGNDTDADTTTGGVDVDTDTDTDADTTDTGELEPVSVELLVRLPNASDWGTNHRFRVLDGVSDGLQAAHELSFAADWLATPLSGHRVVYRLTGAERQIRLGTLDDPLPAATTRLDSGGARVLTEVVPVLNGESVLYAADGTLYRVELDGLDASPPVALVEIRNQASSSNLFATVDPQGRYVLARPASQSGDAVDFARISLSDGDIAMVTQLAPDVTASLPLLSPSGDGGFYVEEEGTTLQRLMYVDLSNATPGTPLPLLSDVQAPDEIGGREESVRPHAEATGFVASIGAQPSGRLVYCGVEGGTPLPPVPLHDSDLRGEFLRSALWSPDGRTLEFVTFDEDFVSQVWLAQFGDGQEPTLIPVGDPVDYYDVPDVEWGPGGDEIFIARFSDDALTWTVERQRILAGSLADPLPFVGPYRYFSFHDTRAEEPMMVFAAAQTETEGKRVYAIDLSSEGGEPVLLSDPGALGESGVHARFSPDGRVVGWETRTLGDPSFEGRLLLADVEAPGRVYEVADGVSGDWTFIDVGSRGR